MKVVVVIDYFSFVSTGAVIAVRRFVEGLQSKGHNVDVVAVENDDNPSTSVPERYIPLVSDFAKQQSIKFAKPDLEILTNAFTGADVVYFAMPFKLERKGRRVAEKMGIPVAAGFHIAPEVFSVNAGIRKTNILSDVIYKIIYNNFYKHFDHIACPNAYTANKLKEMGYHAKLHIVPSGVNKCFVPPEVPRKMDKSHINILMIGRFAEDKRQDVVIKACALSKYADRIYLTLAGLGSTEYRLRHLAEEELKNPVTVSFFEKEDLAKRIAESDLYIHSSEIGIAGIGCAEAFSCGVVPIISHSAKYSAKDFALDERFMFERGNEQELAKKIDFWIENDEQREKAQSEYIEYGKKFSIEYSTDKMEEMLIEVVSSYKQSQKLKTKDARRAARKLVKKGKIWKAFSWAVYYLFSVPILAFYCCVVLGTHFKGCKNVRKLKNSGAISVSNHVHLLDCAMNALALLPRKVVFTALQSNFKIPVAGPYLRLLGGMPVPDRIQDFRVFTDEVNKLLQEGRVVHIYSEAHLINYYAGIRDFYRGAFKIACASQVPILPVVISWRKRKGLYRLFFPNKPCATIVVGEPIYANYRLFKKEMEKDLEERTKTAMWELYNTSNNGKSFDYFEGKQVPTEFKRRSQKKKEESGDSADKTNNVADKKSDNSEKENNELKG